MGQVIGLSIILDENATSKISISKKVFQLSNIEFLQIVNVSDGDLKGIGNLKKLDRLYIWGKNGGLACELDDEWGSFTNIREIIMQGHTFSGNLSTKFSNLKQLQSLAIIESNLSGNFPEFIVPNLGQYNKFSISYNKFTGKLPSSLVNHPKWAYFAKNIIKQAKNSQGFDLTNVEYEFPHFVDTDMITKMPVNSQNIVSNNKLTILFRWATWSPFLSLAIPTLKNIYNTYNSQGVEIIACYWTNYPSDRDGDIHKSIIDNGMSDWNNVLGIPYGTINDNEKVAIPFVTVVDHNNKILFDADLTAAEDTHDVLKDFVDKYLGLVIKD